MTIACLRLKVKVVGQGASEYSRSVLSKTVSSRLCRDIVVKISHRTNEQTNEQTDGRMGQWDSLKHNTFADTVGWRI